jgi:oligoribonuclease NrnB/cAMP/cGMP phosphodiesterase (DHH superfamily)
MNFIIYHKGCMDGFASACVALKHIGTQTTFTKTWSMHYSDPTPNIDPSANVFVVDFSLPLDKLVELASKVRSLVWIDHHESTKDYKETLDKLHNVKAYHDLSECGATLTWKVLSKAPVPQILNYVRDRDLWLWELPKSREYSQGLHSIFGKSMFRITKEECDRFFSISFEEVLAEGVPIYRYTSQINETLAVRARFFQTPLYYEDRTVTAAIANVSMHPSEVCEAMQKLKTPSDIQMAFFSNGKVWIISVRTADDSIDLSRFCAKFGGGGHRKAAGFSMTTEEFFSTFGKYL